MKIAIAGMGLIGGSFYKAALRVGHEVTGFDRNDPVEVANAELVIVALPPDAIVPWIRAHENAFAKGSIVIDVGGVKRPIMEALQDLASADWTFVGGHPMAGKEKGGFENADAELFHGASMLLTPFPNITANTIATLKSFFASVGFGRTIITDPEHHDEMIAFTSQLCHVIAGAYSQDPLVADAPGYSAGSYANMTRIATMDPTTWASLFFADREALLAVLDGFIARLDTFRNALATYDLATVKAWIAAGADAKRRELSARKYLEAEGNA